MPRAPFQVLVIPFRRTPDGIFYALFKRSDSGFRQFIAGGGEGNETPADAALREALEEGGIQGGERLVRLDSIASIPVIHFRDRELWDPDLHVIPEHSFGIEVHNATLRIGGEHTEYRWLCYEEADNLLHFDSNRTALWELNRRLSMEEAGK